MIGPSVLVKRWSKDTAAVTRHVTA